jgi:DNA-binding MarR family transcriptional regulator
LPAQRSGKAAREPELQQLAGVIRATIIPLARLLRQGDFTPTQSSIIGTIDRMQPVTMGDLATIEKLSLPVVSRIVRRLEETGVVVRSVREDDRRAQWISLSDHFTDEIRLSRAERNDELAATLASFTAEEVTALAASVPLLQRLLAAHSG